MDHDQEVFNRRREVVERLRAAATTDAALAAALMPGDVEVLLAIISSHQSALRYMRQQLSAMSDECLLAANFDS